MPDRFIERFMNVEHRASIASDISRTLEELRARIRRYLVIEGASAVVALLCGVFWLTLSLDVVHFQLRKLELPGWFRTTCTLAGLAVLAAAICLWLFAR